MIKILQCRGACNPPTVLGSITLPDNYTQAQVDNALTGYICEYCTPWQNVAVATDTIPPQVAIKADIVQKLQSKFPDIALPPGLSKS